MRRPRKRTPSPDAYNSYRGGYMKLHPQGYIYEYCPTHPACAPDGSIFQHRLVMERHLGRYLTGEEVVHHKNEIVTDNRIENLELFPNKAAHMRHHQRLRAQRYKPEVIEAVRRAASDPEQKIDEIPGISADVARAVCRDQGIEWVFAGRMGRTRRLTEKDVRQALRGRTTKQAAELLGCHPMTLYNRFDHLLKKRKSPTPRIRPATQDATSGDTVIP